MMSEVSEQPFTRETILNLRFPYKLWILISLPTQVLNWCADGVSILLDFAALNSYLLSATSIFKLRTGHKFLRQLSLHGFERLADHADKSASAILAFKHENFQRGRENLVGLIKPENELFKQLPTHPCQEKNTPPQIQRPSDPCFKQVRPLTFIERARLNLSIYLQMQSENFALTKKLSECEKKSPSSAVSVIELPADSFENPFDSISQFEENPEYAGYYGSAPTDQIKQFFDEYLPIYAQANGEEVTEKSNTQSSQKESQTKQSTSTSSFSYVIPNQTEELRADFASNPSNFQIKYSVDLLDTATDNKEYTLNILEETCSRIASSGAETEVAMPSATEGDTAHDINGRDEDISMDEYLKFKENPEKPADGEPTTDGDNDVKPEIMDQDGEAVINKSEPNASGEPGDDDGESNFKNFFNQYRESINLLYE